MSLTKGLVGHWSLDDELYNPTTKRVTDKSAYNNHGTSANAASFVADRMGQADRAMDFNGSSDYVNCGDGDSLNLSAGTISLWFKATNNRAILGNGDLSSSNNQSYVWVGNLTSGYDNESLAFVSKINGILGLAMHVRNGHDFYLDNIWHHCIIQVDGVENTIYMDGVKQLVAYYSGSSTTSGYFLNTLNNDGLMLGKYLYPGSPAYLKGSIADVRIYNRSLSEAEITLLYESYRPKTIIV